jgi:hypothetical protein
MKAVCRTAIVLAVVGVFGTWRDAGGVSLDGFEGPHNGWLVIVFALIALVGVGSLSRGGWLGVVTVLGCAAVMLFTAIGNVVDDGSVLGGNSSWGVWLAMAASAVLVGAGLLVAVRRLRGNMRAGPRTNP